MKKENEIIINVEDLLPSRKQLLFPLCVVGFIFFVPFFIFNLVRGNYLLSLGLFAITLVFAANGYAIRRRRKIPFPFEFLLIPAVISIVLSIIYQGDFGSYWCYPSLLFFYFVLSRRMANICSILLLGVITGILTQYSHGDLTVRFFVSLSLVIVMANIIVSAINELHRKLLDQTIKDPLTGAFNRRHMNSHLSDAVSQMRRNRTPASILLLDIDHFKKINDELGHGMGDRVLIDMVRLVIQRIRHTDKLFRIGGEEFLIFLPATNEADAATVANHLCDMIAGSPLLEGRQVTVSIGVSQLEPEETFDDWIRHADEVLYQAKQSGRNRYVCRNADSETAVSEKSGISNG